MSFFPPGFLRRQLITKPPVPTASFTGETVIVTGSNSGLGLEASRWIVRLGASKVILACRNLEKGQGAAKSIQQSTSCRADVLEVWQLDMSSYASIRNFAAKVQTELPRLDALLANAGINSVKWEITEQDESVMTTNVVSTTLLMCLLHPKLRETAHRFNTQGHITVTGSEMYQLAKFEQRLAPPGQIFAWLSDKSKNKVLDRYQTSKLLIHLIARQMASLSPVESSNVIINFVAPGFCESSLARDLANNPVFWAFTKAFARTTEEGSRALVYGAGAGPNTHGQYVPDCVVEPMLGLAAGEAGRELQERVWTELGEKLEKVAPGVTRLS